MLMYWHFSSADSNDDRDDDDVIYTYARIHKENEGISIAFNNTKSINKLVQWHSKMEVCLQSRFIL